MAEDLNAEQASRLYETLEDIREKLVRVNTLSGGLERYQRIRREIRDTGWKRICEKYHPDINTDDPAAFELFAFYRFVYNTMERENQ